MARRWLGPFQQHKRNESLAGIYASQLRTLHEKCVADPRFRVDVLGYSTYPFDHTKANSFGAAGEGVREPRNGAVSNEDSGRYTGQGAQQSETTFHAPEDRPPRFSPPSPPLQPPSTLQAPASLDVERSVQVSSRATPQDNLREHYSAMSLPSRNGVESADELSAISHMLMDQQFMEMDRVISFDDMMFTAQTAGGTTPTSLPAADWTQRMPP